MDDSSPKLVPPPSPKRPRNARITEMDYYALLDAYRAGIKTEKGLARKFGIARNTAHRAISRGWPERGWYSLREAIAIEQAAMKDELKARAVDEARKQLDIKDQLRKDALSVIEQEGRLIALARGDVTAVLGIAAGLMPAIRALAQRAHDQLVAALANPDYKVDVPAVLIQLQRYTNIIRMGSDAMNVVVQTERVRGNPSDRLEADAQERFPDMTEEEAVSELQRVIDTVQRKEELGLVVIDGGKGKAGPGIPGGPQTLAAPDPTAA